MPSKHFTVEQLKERYPLSMRVHSPDDIKNFSLEDFEQLGREYRDYLIEICSRNGGHLGPGLGVVELTMALHKVFDSPRDKIVWDIGHQAYPHKLLTGRFVEFQGLREEDGVSGFCRRHESPHDIFGAGHAGTSISAAIGIAEGMRRKGEPFKTIAIIGDAGLTAGMAYEGLHQAAEYKKNLVVVVNDNKMSIAPNVGAIHAFLSRQMASPFVQHLQEDVKSLASKIPLIGDEVVDALGRIKHSLKNMIVPTVIFEALGFKYYGPFDGHDMAGLIDIFEKTKETEEPILIHVITEKGRGYAPAIADKETFHGCGPYERESGKVAKDTSAPPAFSKVYGETIKMLCQADPKVVAITAAMPAGTGLTVVAKECSTQFYDVGISEQHAATFAAGLATEGMKPHVAIYSTFMQRAYDQVIHDVCIQNLNVKFGMDRSGFVGADGATHNGTYDVAFMRAIPLMDCCAPKDERELQELVVAMDRHVGPACIRYPRGSGFGLPLYKKLEEVKPIQWGTAEVIYYSGVEKDFGLTGERIEIETLDNWIRSEERPLHVGFIAYGAMVIPAMKAAQELKQQKIHSFVVNLRFVKPLDEKLLAQLAGFCSKLITVEDHVLNGGVGSAVLEFYEKKGLLQKLQIERLGIPDEFFEQASVSKLYKVCGIDIPSMVERARRLAVIHELQPQKANRIREKIAQV